MLNSLNDFQITIKNSHDWDKSAKKNNRFLTKIPGTNSAGVSSNSITQTFPTRIFLIFEFDTPIFIRQFGVDKISIQSNGTVNKTDGHTLNHWRAKQLFHLHKKGKTTRIQRWNFTILEEKIAQSDLKSQEQMPNFQVNSTKFDSRFESKRK